MSILLRFIITLFIFCDYDCVLSCDVEHECDKDSMVVSNKRPHSEREAQDSKGFTKFQWSGNSSAFTLYDNPRIKKTTTYPCDNGYRQEGIEFGMITNPSVDQYLGLRNSNFTTLNIDANYAVFNDDDDGFDNQPPANISNSQHYDCIQAIENLDTNDDKLKAQRLLLLFKGLESSSIENFIFDITHLNTCHFNILFNQLGWHNLQRYKVKKLTLKGETGEPQFQSLTYILSGFNSLFQLEEITLKLNDLLWRELFDPEAEKIKQNFFDELCRYNIQKINLPQQDLDDETAKPLALTIFWKFKVNYHYLPSFKRMMNLCDNNVSDSWKQWYPDEFFELLKIVTNQ